MFVSSHNATSSGLLLARRVGIVVYAYAAMPRDRSRLRDVDEIGQAIYLPATLQALTQR
jgi:hypothetical protein